jgi:hypothetical protein
VGGGHLQQEYGDFLTVQESIWLNSTKQIFKVDRREIHFLRFTLESYDGMALVSTIDPYVALIKVSMAPGCETLVLELIDALRKDEGLSISSSH